jgi:ATP-binding cassette subfamily C protein
VPFFRQFAAGDLTARAMGIDTIRQVLTGSVIASLLAGLFSLFNLGLLFAYDAGLAVLATILVLIAVGATAAASTVQLRYERPLSALQASIAGTVLQLISGIAKLRVAGAEGRAYAVWAAKFTAQRKLAYQAQTTQNRLEAFNAAFPIVASIAIFAVVALRSAPLQSTGIFLAFIAAFGGLLAAALEMSLGVLSILRIVPLFEQAQPILQALPEVDQGKASPGELRGAIDVSHVSFRYGMDGPLLLHDISMRIEAGEFVAIVGPSGSGKSTLLRLLLGFETPEIGAIRYDNRNLAELDLEAVRRQIGVVLQNGKLMPGDIYTNIVGSSLLTIDDAWDAATLAGLANDIRQMPMGMHTVISEAGSTFSGGQRQRLMIARALVAKPRILLFDEATSALDNRTQALVSTSLERLEATRIVIAHRLSTIINADRIYVVEAGRIVQQGTYAELVDQGGPFGELIRRQML